MPACKIKEWISEGYKVKFYRHDDDTTDWGGIEKNVTMITLSMHVIFTLQEFDSNIYISSNHASYTIWDAPPEYKVNTIFTEKNGVRASIDYVFDSLRLTSCIMGFPCHLS